MTTHQESSNRSPRGTAAEARARKTTTTVGQPTSKRAFVLSFDRRTPVAEIMAAATKQHIDLAPAYIYWVRSDAERKARSPRHKGADTPPRARKSRPSTGVGRAGLQRSSASSSQPVGARPGATAATSVTAGERIILETALQIVGIERALEVLEAAQARLHRLLDD